MATKTISVKVEAYERLCAARRYPTESFSEVVLRATWPELTTTGEAYLLLCQERGPVFGDAELDLMEHLKHEDAPAQNKWKTRSS